MGFAKEIVRAVGEQPIRGTYLLGCWLRDYLPQLQAQQVLRAIDERLRQAKSTPEFVLTCRGEHTLHLQCEQLNLEVTMHEDFFEINTAHALRTCGIESMRQASLF